jgi:ppGpp synthetase/RelA/SpoT-type nucleotidyltranferase
VAWAVSKYTRGEVARAGRVLISTDASADDRSHALDVMSSWRAAHAYPMHALLMLLRRKTAELDKRAIVVQRHKRAPSIIYKLTRYPKMELSRMQDIGGCRAIVSSARDVERLSDLLIRSSSRHKLHRVYDYIKEPKESGYRGVHLTYKYGGEKPEYEDFFVELQLRSKIQHAWATCVEIVDTFTKQALKSSRGSKDWQDFFLMVSAEFARLERRPVGSHVDGIDSKSMLIRLSNRLNVVERLNAFAVSANHIIQKRDEKTDYFLLELDHERGSIRVNQFKTQDLDEASRQYLEKEKEAKERPRFDVVLVAAGSLHALESAYPNYFADSKEFVRYMLRALSIANEV